VDIRRCTLPANQAQRFLFKERYELREGLGYGLWVVVQVVVRPAVQDPRTRLNPTSTVANMPGWPSDSRLAECSRQGNIGQVGPEDGCNVGVAENFSGSGMSTAVRCRSQEQSLRASASPVIVCPPGSP
jgi:hypothetical protein